MEQVDKINSVCNGIDLLNNFFGELGHLDSHNSRMHVKIVDEYLPELISERNQIKGVLAGKSSSIRLNSDQNLKDILECLNKIISILLRMSAKQTDAVFISKYYGPLKLIFKTL